MTRTIRGHFDGKVIVPEEQVDLPVNLSLEFHVELVQGLNVPDEDWEAALKRLKANGVKGLSIGEESLKREAIYSEPDE
jgi:hypothetical protein